MAEYIKREALLREIKTAQESLQSDDPFLWDMNKKYHAGLAWAHRIVLESHAADVAPVVHGRWIKRGQDIYCSECGKESGYTWAGASRYSDYCPNCWAKMDATDINVGDKEG